MRLAFFVGFLCQASPRTILTRSRHLPVGVTEGSRKRNLNKSGVRLWTDRSGDYSDESILHVNDVVLQLAECKFAQDLCNQLLRSL
jgi:hypothetical protein